MERVAGGVAGPIPKAESGAGLLPGAGAGAAAVDDANRRVRGRRHIERLVALAQHLPPADRQLIERIYSRGDSFAAVADDRSLSPRTLRYRVESLVRHLHSRDYQYLADCLDHLPRDLRAAATRLVFQRQTLRETARLTHVSIHVVRQRRTRLRAWLDARHLRPPRSAPRRG